MRFYVWFILGLLSFTLLYLLVGPMFDVLVYSLFMYYIARPLHALIHRRVKSAPASAVISLCILVLPITLLLVYTAFVASTEASNFITTATTPYLTGVNKLVGNYSIVYKQLSPDELIQVINKSGDAQELMSIASSMLFGAFGVFFKILIMLLVSFYLLVDGSSLRRWAVARIFPEESHLLKKLFDEIDYDLNQVFFGNIFTALIIAISGILLFNILNIVGPSDLRLPYPILLGLLCGVTSLIPAVGVAFVWVPATAYLVVKSMVHETLVAHAWFILAFVISTALLVDYGPNLIVRPHVSGRRIHRGLLMISYIFGPISFGLMGLFLGPMILVIVVNTMKVIAEHGVEESKPKLKGLQ